MKFSLYALLRDLFATELGNLTYAIAGALVPAFILSKVHPPIPQWPDYSFMGWMAVQMFVYAILRTFYAQRKAAR